MDRRALLERVFRQLPVLANEEYHIEIVVDMLAGIDVTNPRTIPASFAIVGRKKTKNELTKIAKHAAALAKSFESLHQPAILLLADIGFCNMRHQLPQILNDMERKISHADLSGIEETPKGGRPEDKLAQAVANIIAWYYYNITGKEPGRIVDSRAGDATPYGPFIHLLNEVFGILTIKANTDYFAKKSIKTLYNRSLFA